CPAIVLGIIAGLPWGALGVAIACAGVRCLLAVPSMWFALRGSPVHLADAKAAVWRPVCLSALLYLSVISARSVLSPGSPVAVAGLSLLFGLTLFLSALVLW